MLVSSFLVALFAWGDESKSRKQLKTWKMNKKNPKQAPNPSCWVKIRCEGMRQLWNPEGYTSTLLQIIFPLCTQCKYKTYFVLNLSSTLFYLLCFTWLVFHSFHPFWSLFYLLTTPNKTPRPVSFTQPTLFGSSWFSHCWCIFEELRFREALTG